MQEGTEGGGAYICVSTGIMSAIRFVCFLSFILSVFLHFLLLYFVVISLSLFYFYSVFFLFFFLGARPYAAIFFNVPAGGVNGHRGGGRRRGAQ